jgi:hypothetical protein
MQQSTAPQKKEYCPGELAPVAGIYEVLHAEHRGPHQAILLAGETFPCCRTCKDAVRFRLARHAEHINGDRDLGSDPQK